MNLFTSDIELVGRCLRAAAEGPFFEDWEFSTLFGLDRAEVSAVAALWPAVDGTDPKVQSAVQGSLGHLLGYPHGLDAELEDRIQAPKSEIAAVFSRWNSAQDASADSRPNES